MTFDYSKLLGRIKEKYGTQEKFAQAMGTSGTVLSRKLNNGSTFDQKEIVKATKLLGISDKDFKKYFFTTKVHISEQNKVS
ncbi:DUF739 family protein [Lactococcus petauri]|jgi:transcriptional regulator with XRE-family HTH domain|uniref:DUF739 family protein n=1 Tax=Lactococcus TaxID=1357 RepID=UPI0013FD719A|nr:MULTISPECIES: DUF739 family protein [Lactococcus]MCG3096954.1 DUF739 family protein [Lactococcus petauri]NHI71733.1 DUF739 family protein [Lactococcus petauri]